MIDLQPTPAAADLTRATLAFVRDEILPLEEEHGGDIARGGEALRERMQERARAAGVFAPHVPREYGGHGLDMRDRAPVFEAAGHSVFGPLALNIAAPDEGNVHLLDHVATPDQRERFLEPLCRGRVRSAFAMTEPAPGAGADPSALATTATRVPGGWRVDGRKTFITGADGAGFLIIMARTSGSPGDRGGATMFLSPADAPGLTVGRHVRTMDTSMLGGHCEVAFDSLFVPDENVLGEVDQGFHNAQVRLGPARMTHVMRWLGSAQRAQDIAAARAAERELFGSRLGDLGLARQLIADNEIDLAATRALLVRACWELDTGADARTSTSVAKTFAAEAIHRVVDRAVQLCGGLGVSDDLPLARLLREVRPFRIYDGPSEVHRWSIAARVVKGARAR
ncbi:acyl-CoA dehydrogenase family protein [Nocardiopsis changdeensis]|uniref:Acyl-CoA dehydrogenase family protein n=1 Tax=Nocardiopsis changdeensis TaxID=2831969 RepID=A0ABX8BSQ9_9ACTN|nr:MULTISPECIES: acyl-CoA dehydrogenase family protein [Nocardiopsis]QUX25275.1 acyl-CoA dehydrogenase family protein [Nocardiopsis changdeensis]QYX35662.1 acyl-CoA dehydrogenase family protein [Nocardiopsis sp. MT53]